MGPFPMFYAFSWSLFHRWGRRQVHVFCGGGVKPSHDVQEPLSEVHCVFLAGGGGRCPGPGSRTPGRWRETSAWRHPREKAHHTARRPLVKAAGQADHHATRLQGDPAVLAPGSRASPSGRKNAAGSRSGSTPSGMRRRPRWRSRSGSAGRGKGELHLRILSGDAVVLRDHRP